MGRSADLDLLRSVVDDPSLRAVVITAPAGAGKTRLAREAAALLDAPPLWLHASPAVSAVPFGAMAHIPDLPIDDPASMHRWITDASKGAGGVVVIDDAPHLDARTADLVQRLVDAEPVTVIATAREGVEIPPWLEWLWIGGATRHVELGPLPHADIGDLVTIVLGHLAPREHDRIVGSLSTRTSGNALFLRELLVDLRQRDRVGGPLVLDGAAPKHLLRVLQARLADAGGVVVPLRATAVLGDLPLVVLRRCAPDDQITAAEAGGWLAIDSSARPTVRPAHPLYAEASLAAISTLDRTDLVEHVAQQILATTGSTAAERLRATAALVGLGVEVDVDHLVEAARTAFSALDHDLSARLAATAVTKGGDSFEALLVLGAAQSGAGRSDDAEASLRGALGAARTDDQRARSVGRLSVHLVAFGGRIGEAEALLDEIEPLLTDPAARSFVAADRAKLASIRGDLTAVAAQLDDAADDVTRLNAAITGAYIEAMAGDAASCRATIARALPLAEAHIAVLPWSGELIRFSGPFAALLEAGPGAAETEARDGGSGTSGAAEATRGTWDFLTGFAAAIAGRLDAAAQSLDQAAAELDGHDLINARPLAIAARSWVAAQAGDADLARTLLDQSADAALIDGRVRIQATVTDVWCDAIEDDPTTPALDERSTQRLLATAHEASQSGQALTALIVLNELTRLGAPHAARPVSEDITRDLPPSWFARFVTDRARAEASKDDISLRRLAREAQAAWPVAAAEIHASRARITRERRDGVAADRAALAAHLATASLGSAVPRSVAAVRSPLTERELAVAQAVASGSTNRAIAEHADVSTRTVENQLQSAYRKLGLAGRKDLISLLRS